MIKRLEEAFAAASKLLEPEQEISAELVLKVSKDQQWMETFAGSQDALAQLSSEAEAEYHAERTQPIEPERL